MSAEADRVTSLVHKPDLEEAQKRWRAFWAGEIIDRPVVRVMAPKTGAKQFTHPPGVHLNIRDFDGLIEQYDRWASGVYFGGEAIPAFLPNFGPDQFAAALGAELEYSPHSPETTWVKPIVEDWSQAGDLEHPRGEVWERLLQLVRRTAELGRGRFLCAIPDMHGNIDGLSALRGPERLCLDLIDDPDSLEPALDQLFRGFSRAYDAVYEAGKMSELGSTSWLPLYSEGRYLPLQCDFACMISPQQFRRFVMPWLEKESALGDCCAYHYDGPDALVHMDDLLSIKSIPVVQWQPGAGNPPLIEWIDLLKRIQKAGKGLYLWGTPDEVKQFHRELAPNLVMYDTWAASEAEADELLAWLVANT